MTVARVRLVFGYQVCDRALTEGKQVNHAFWPISNNSETI